MRLQIGNWSATNKFENQEHTNIQSITFTSINSGRCKVIQCCSFARIIRRRNFQLVPSGWQKIAKHQILTIFVGIRNV